MTAFPGSLTTALSGVKLALVPCALCWDSDMTMLVFGGLCYLLKIGTKGRKNQGLPVTHSQSLSSGHFHVSISCIPNLVLLPKLNSWSVPTLPNLTLHLYFLPRTVVSPVYHVLKMVTLKLVFFSSFLSHIPSLTPIQIFIAMFWFCHQHMPNWLYLLCPLCHVLCFRLAWSLAWTALRTSWLIFLSSCKEVYLPVMSI